MTDSASEGTTNGTHDYLNVASNAIGEKIEEDCNFVAFNLVR